MTVIIRPRDGRKPVPQFVRAWLPERCGLVLMCARATRYSTNPVIIEALRAAHWEPCEGGVCW